MKNKLKAWLYNTLYSKESYQEAANRAYDRGIKDGKMFTEAEYENHLALLEEINRNLWLVDPDYVFSITKSGLVKLNDTQITDRELKNLKSEVRALKDFQIYKIMQNTIRQKAIEMGVLNVTDLYSLKGNEQVLAGKMMVWNLDIIKTILDKIEKSKT